MPLPPGFHYERVDPVVPTRCPYCDRVMSQREASEQGACNDCYGDRGYEIPSQDDIG